MPPRRKERMYLAHPFRLVRFGRCRLVAIRYYFENSKFETNLLMIKAGYRVMSDVNRCHCPGSSPGQVS